MKINEKPLKTMKINENQWKTMEIMIFHDFWNFHEIIYPDHHRKATPDGQRSLSHSETHVSEEF